MPKWKQITCRCKAYPFPHRKGGGACAGKPRKIGDLTARIYGITEFRTALDAMQLQLDRLREIDFSAFDDAKADRQ